MRNLFFISLLVGILVSCSKDKDETPEVPAPNYFPLKTGNYWVYQQFSVDSNKVEKEIMYTDSTVVDGDTIINSKKYHRVLYFKMITEYSCWKDTLNLRDSSGYIVTSEGSKHLSWINFTDTLRQKLEVIYSGPLYFLSFKMEEVTDTVTVPAGKFKVINCKGTLQSFVKDVPEFRYENNLYADGIGPVVTSYHYFSEAKVYESRLTRYNVKP